MNKDQSIVSFIDRLKSILDFNLIKIVDNWEPDLCAIGLKRGNKLVYISTYNYANESIIKYDYDLEMNNGIELDKIEILKEGRGISESETINEIRSFLNV